MRKSLLVTALFAAVVVASLAFTNDEPRYKNLKVLPKNITKQQMDSVMHQFNGSLGVKCNYCHQYNAEAKTMDFASDANKNLKVLPKNITKQQMDSVMHQFTGSLGVKCNYCHQYNAEAKTMDFASDANKKKLVARNMLKMTAKINKKYFDVAGKQNLDAKLMVGCYTCHHGQEEPTVVAPHMEGPMQGPPPRPQGTQQAPGADTTKRQ